MRSKLLLMLLGMSFLSGCGTIAKSREIVDYVHDQKKQLEELYEKGQAEVDKRLDQIEQKATKTEADLAGVGIALDKDGDGKVTHQEAAAAIADLGKGAITDSGKRELLLDPQTYYGLGSAVLASILGTTALSRRRRKNQRLEELESQNIGA